MTQRDLDRLASDTFIEVSSFRREIRRNLRAWYACRERFGAKWPYHPRYAEVERDIAEAEAELRRTR